MVSKRGLEYLIDLAKVLAVDTGQSMDETQLANIGFESSMALMLF